MVSIDPCECGTQRRITRSTKPRIYVETSVTIYLTNRPALDVITAGHQATTYQWWEQQRTNYDLVISQLVVKEAGAGDPLAAARRLATLESIPMLDANRPEVENLAEALVVNGALPMKAFVDASHIANGFMMKKIQNVCIENGFDCQQLLTPLQL